MKNDKIIKPIALFGALHVAVFAATMSADAVQIVPGDYSHTLYIAFPGYKGSTTLANFPVLVRLSPGLNGFKYSNCKLENGGDLRFADSDGNLLASEIDTWDVSGTSLIWVKVPTFNKNTVIKAYYGCSNPPAVDPKEVWSADYMAVWHMNDAGKSMTDSTNGGETLSEVNNAGNVDSILSGQSGLCGNAVKFATASDNTGGLATTDLRYKTAGATDLTVEFWSYQDSFDPTNLPYSVYYMREVATTGTKTIWQTYGIQSTSGGMPGKTAVRVSLADGTTKNQSSDMLYPLRGEWTYQYFRIANTTRFYQGLNRRPAVDSATFATGVTNHSGNSTLYIGNQGKSTAAFPGKIDEVRISSVARSDDWMNATYDMIKDDAFVNYCGAENDWDKYAYKFSVSFSEYDGETELTNFPALLRLSEYDEVSGSGIRGFRYADFMKKNGNDLRFADASGNMLPSEVEIWITNGESIVWVSVPKLTPNGENKITAYYGHLLAPQVDSISVWTNGYVAVWHMNGDGAGLTDSTCGGISLAEHSNNAGKNLFGQVGIAGAAVGFDHDGLHRGGLETSDQRYRLAGRNAFTLELWAWQDTYDPGQLDHVMTYLAESRLSPSQSAYALRDMNSGSGAKGRTQFAFTDGELKNDGTVNMHYLGASDGVPARGQWNYQVVRYDGAQYVHELNAVSKHSLNYNAITNMAGTTLFVGNGSRDGAYAYSGKIDEIRISSEPRSDDWIQATYDTINDNAKFTTYGVVRNQKKGFIILVR